MEDNGVVELRADGTYALAGGRPVIIRRSRALALERVASLAAQLLQTGMKNSRIEDIGARDVDRIAKIYHLPAKYISLWREVSRERTESYLEGLDNWLEDHNDPDFDGLTVEASVHAYSYVGESQREEHNEDSNRQTADEVE
jgi:hypothetical protein